MMSRKTKKLKVEGLPLDITEDKIKIVFQNAKRKGGGPVERVEIYENDNTCTAIITFETIDAVDLILSRGSEVEVFKRSVTIEPVFDDIMNEKPRAGEKQVTISESDASFSDSQAWSPDNIRIHTKGNASKGAKPKISNERFKAQSARNSSCAEKSTGKSPNKKTAIKQTGDSDIDHGPAKKSQSKFGNASSKCLRRSQEMVSEENKSESELSDLSVGEEIMPWETTVKAELLDPTLVSKDRYLYYFEDLEVSQGSFKSESLLLDGVNKLLFVTFDTKEAAEASCQFMHEEEDSNFQNVRMATPEDFDTYNNLLFVQGYPCDTEDRKKELKKHVEDVTGMNVEDILLGEDPMKAIIAFDPEQCEDISEATWQCADNDGKILLTTAPVKRTYSIRVQGLKPSTTAKVLKRYMSSKISGGGPMKSVEKLSETEAIVHFQDEEDFDGVLEKNEHMLERNTLHVEPYYPCLGIDCPFVSTETYQYESTSMPADEKTWPLGTVQKSGPTTHPANPHKKESLYFCSKSLYLSTDVSYHSNIFYGVMRLDEYGFHSLQRYKKELDIQAAKYNCRCKFDNRDNQFLLCLELDYPKKLYAAQVKGRLRKAIICLCQYLQQFQYQKAKVNATHIHHFQDFCQSKVQKISYDGEIQFSHQSNEVFVLCKSGAVGILKQLDEMYKSFLSNLDNESVGNSNMQTGKITPSLSRAYEQKSLSQKPTDSDEFKASGVQRFISDGATATVEDDIMETSNMKTLDDNFGLHNDNPEEEEIITERFDIQKLILFQKTGKFGDLEKADASLRLTIDFENLQVIIKGKDKQSVSQAHVELLKFSINIQKKNVTESITSNQLKLLSQKHICDRINKLFDEQRIPAYFQCIDRNALVYVVSNVEDEKWEKIIQSQVVEKKKIIDNDSALLFETEKGKTFVTDLFRNDDTEVQLQENQMLVVASASQHDSIAQKIKTFIEQNKLHIKQIPFSPNKWMFIKRFMRDELKEIEQSWKKERTELIETGKNLHLKGLIEHVTQGEARLVELHEKILSQDKTFKYYGIKEFLQDTLGEQLLKGIEERQSCYIIPKTGRGSRSRKGIPHKTAQIMTDAGFQLAKSETTDSQRKIGRDPGSRGTTNLNSRFGSVNFSVKIADITNEKCDAIVCSIKDSMDLSNSGAVCKCLLKKCGSELQDECEAQADDMALDGVVMTSAPNLKCQNIFFVSTEQFKQKWDEGILAVLTEAEREGMKSVALPVLGSRIKGAEHQLLRRKTLDGVKTFSESSPTYLSDVRLVVYNQEILDQMMGQDRSFFHYPENVRAGAVNFSNKFGSVNFSVKIADITNEKCDAIVCSIDDSMNLSNSGAVCHCLLKKCGSGLQDECKALFDKMAQDGVARTSAPNLSCQNILFVSGDHFSQNWNEGIAAVLAEAERKKMKSIALPVLGSGIQGADHQLLKAKILDGVKKFSESSPTFLTDVRLVVYNQGILDRMMGQDKKFFHHPENWHTGAVNLNNKFGSVNFSVRIADITNEKCDAIVCSIRDSMVLSNSGAVCQCLLKKCGSELQDECKAHSDRMAQDGIVIISAPNLKCQNILFVSTDQFSQKWDEGTLAVLSKAEREEMKSIALPVLGSGNLGANHQLLKRKVLDGVKKFSESSPNFLIDVRLVVYNQGILNQMMGQDRRFFHHPENYPLTDASNLNNKFGSVNFSVKIADITNEKCDAIVCSIKDSMDLSNSGAVCLCLLKKCGSELQDECKAKYDEMAQDGTAWTSAPNLQCQNILFISQDQFSQKWDEGILDVLTKAEREEMKSVALPVLGIGIQRADHQLLKILDGVKKFSESSPVYLTDVRLVVYNQWTLDQMMTRDRRLFHHLEKRHAADQNSPHFTTTVSEAMDLRFYNTNPAKIQMAIQELEKALKSSFKQDKLLDKEITKINDQQVRELEEESAKHCVRMTIKPKDGKVLMEGFKNDSRLLIKNKLMQIIMAIKENDQKQLHKIIPLAVQWQYEAEEGNWRNFEASLNIDIEKEYKTKSKSCDITDTKDRKYRIFFKTMKEFQVDQSGNMNHEICSVRRKDLTKGGIAFPEQWALMKPGENLKLVAVKPDSEEFKAVLKKFIHTGGGKTIKKLKRIQNESLYQQYKVKKNEMDKRNPKGHQNEQRLYHGTDPQAIQAILENGFSRNYRGKNATAYGNGVYFAENASYSTSYTHPDAKGERKMFQVRVLTGESTNSSSGMNFLPNKPGTTTPYDSGRARGMYIIFHDVQAYPEYLITF